ncbi:ATP-dependent DNA helicase RecQ [Shewanella sp. SR44-3]|uniref:RecQ family ATP-dependent DNA helicase n=1 Tax=Shewanella sp. SR44-3 TaxID=2760936 RepID=UPI00385768C8
MTQSNYLPQLKTQFGFDDFRDGQAQVIESILSNNSALAIFPTGSGKSLCYQFCALQLPHLTLVISPLLALMKDQLAFLHGKGIAAASIDSGLSAEQSRQTMQDIRQGKIKILMVSVERFNNERFRHFLQSVQISLLVVDEAHCISEWGHNFRPDYLKIPQYCQDFAIDKVLLLTATATRKVKRDMAERFAIDAAHIVQTGFYRENLALTVLSVPQVQKNAELVQQLQALAGAGIVYVTLQHTADEIATFLQRQGFNAKAYHAGMEQQTRQQVQSAFMASDIQIIVATIAFGMGIDKGDIRFVIHYDLPKSIENYSQEIGRAGRDNQPSKCITLANLDGLSTVENFVYGDTPEGDSISTLLQHIQSTRQGARWEMQELSLAKLTNIRVLALKTLLVQLELLGLLKPSHAYYADCRFKFISSEADILALFTEERREFLQQVFAHTHFKKIWGSIDFDGLYQALGHERQRVLKALDYLSEQGHIQLETKQLTQVFALAANELEIEAIQSQLLDYFNDKETKEIARIAQLVRFFELKTCLSHALARYFDDDKSPAQCMSCSVCLGRPVHLTATQISPMPAKELLDSHLQQLQVWAEQHSVAPKLSLSMKTKFLMGLSMPAYSRSGLTKLAGFGLCATQRFHEVKMQLSTYSEE